MSCHTLYLASASSMVEERIQVCNEGKSNGHFSPSRDDNDGNA